MRQLSDSQVGMSLRDYMATHAPASEIGKIVPRSLNGRIQYLGEDLNFYYLGEVHDMQCDAKARYQWADAMLAAR